MNKKMKRIKIISYIIVALLIIVANVLLFYNNTFGKYPATPEEWLIRDTDRNNNVKAIITVNYETDILGFSYITKHGDEKQRYGIQVQKIEQVNILGVKRYKPGVGSANCYYSQVDENNYEERYEQLLERKIMYGLADDIGRSRIPTDICNVFEFDVEGKTYWFFYERP